VIGIAPAEIAAVAAATGRPVGSLHGTADTTVAADDGTVWRVTTPGLPGLLELGDPQVHIVAPDSMDGPQRPVWLARVPGRGWIRIHGAGPLAVFLGAYPELPGETIARLVAVLMGPRGAERVLIGDPEIDSMLAELAARIPAGQRVLTFERPTDGIWTVGFLGSLLLRSSVDRGWRLSVARWRVVLDSARRLSSERTELLTDVILDRYRV